MCVAEKNPAELTSNKNKNNGDFRKCKWLYILFTIRRVWRYQRGNQNPYIEEEQATQWPKVKVLKDKQWSTKKYT
jgi:hypothetical protein